MSCNSDIEHKYAILNPECPSGCRLVRGEYNGKGPSITGDEIKPIFEGKNNNQVYHIVQGKKWLFYNDSNSFEIVVQTTFGLGSKLQPLGSTTMTSTDDGFYCELIVGPGETEPFVEGDVNGFKSSFKQSELSKEYQEKRLQESETAAREAIAKAKDVTNNDPFKVKDPEEVLNKCIENNVPFVDISFPPLTDSIYREGIDNPTTRKITWGRPNDYLPPNWLPYVRLFHNIRPDDIDQGYLGDCYYLCALACLSEYPEKVIDLFMHPKDNRLLHAEQKVGAHRVTLNKSGWWTTYLLDNYFPMYGTGLFYARCIEDPAELWVQLMEKAQAKAHGSYSAIAAGDPLQALQDLTGYPVYSFSNELKEKDENFFHKVLRWEQENNLIVLTTPSDPVSGIDHNKVGLPLLHCFSVLHAVEIEGNRLLHIRNPWGDDKEWNGAWSDKDDRWKQNPAVAKACNFTPAKDGTFWMEWNDVMIYFTGGGVCFLKFGWHDYRIKCHAINGIPNIAFEIKVTKKTEVFFALHQKDKRGFPDDHVDANYHAFILAITRKEGGNQKIHLHSSLDCENPTPKPTYITGRDISMRYTLEPEFSPYLLIPRVYEKKEKDFVVSVISSNAVGDGIEINFKNLGEKCPIYDNYLSFVYDSDKTPKQITEFQYRPETGIHEEGSGDHFAVNENEM